jgi:hypothetical protein
MIMSDPGKTIQVFLNPDRAIQVNVNPVWAIQEYEYSYTTLVFSKPTIAMTRILPYVALFDGSVYAHIILSLNPVSMGQ